MVNLRETADYIYASHRPVATERLDLYYYLSRKWQDYCI